MSFLLLMIHRYKKWGDISKVTSGGRAEIKNLKNDTHSHSPEMLQMLLLKCYCTFPIQGALGKNVFLKDDL